MASLSANGPRSKHDSRSDADLRRRTPRPTLGSEAEHDGIPDAIAHDIGSDGTIVGQVDERGARWNLDGSFARIGYGFGNDPARSITNAGHVLLAQAYASDRWSHPCGTDDLRMLSPRLSTTVDGRDLGDDGTFIGTRIQGSSTSLVRQRLIIGD